MVVGILGKALTQSDTRPVSLSGSLSSKDSVKSPSLLEEHHNL